MQTAKGFFRTQQLQAPPTVEEADQAILHALTILRARFKERDVYATPDSVKDFLRLQAQGLPHEVFAVMFLDVHNRLIDYERMFRGTLVETAIYPRELVKRALELNAATVILHHNHPGGMCTPSRADEAVTKLVKASLALVDILLLDHVITSDEGALSMAEQKLI